MSTLKKLSFGQDSAESEIKSLRYLYLPIPFYERLKDTKKWLVLGRKGSGKTATCLMFFEQIKNQYNTSLITPKSISTAKSSLLGKASLNIEEAAIQKWKFVFLMEAARYLVHIAEQKLGENHTKWSLPLQKVRNFLIENDENSANQLDKALKFVRSINKFAISAFKVEGSLELDKQTPNGSALSDDIDLFMANFYEASKSIQQEPFYFLVDQVDDLWDSTKEGQDLIIGLLRASKEINDKFEDVKVIVFLRSDIFSYLRFHNSDHYRSHTELISWNTENLKKLIVLRIRKSTENRGNVDSLWNSVFPNTIDGKDSFEFIVQYTLMRPRDLIQLCNMCRDSALDRNETNKIAEIDIINAIKKHSNWKSEDLVSEYSVQYPFLENILRGMFYTNPSYEINRERIQDLFGKIKDDMIGQYGSKFFEPLDVLLQALYSISFLGVVNKDEVLYEFLGDKVILPYANLFHVHRVFREVLRIPDPNISSLEKRLADDTSMIKLSRNSDVYVGGDVITGTGNITQGVGNVVAGNVEINISGSVSSNVILGKFDVNNQAELSHIFSKLSVLVEKLPEGPEKSIAQNAIQALEAEAIKGDNAEEAKIGRWFNFLAETAPDVWEVAVDSFIIPIRGISTAFRKIAERAKKRG